MFRNIFRHFTTEGNKGGMKKKPQPLPPQSASESASATGLASTTRRVSFSPEPEPGRPRSESVIYSSSDSQMVPQNSAINDFLGMLLLGFSYFLVFLFFPLSMCFCLRVVKEYERAVVFRLGRLLAGDAKGPGIVIILPCIDTYRKVTLIRILKNFAKL